MSGFGHLHEFESDVPGSSHKAPQYFWFSWSHRPFLHHALSSQRVSAASLFQDSFLRKPQNLSPFLSWYREQRPCHKDLVLQVPSVFSFLLLHICLCHSPGQQLSGFSLSYWCSVSSHIISLFQTCYGLIFLRREAPKTYKVLEGKKYSFLPTWLLWRGLGDEVWGQDREEGNTDIGWYSLSSMGLFFIKLLQLFWSSLLWALWEAMDTRARKELKTFSV